MVNGGCRKINLGKSGPVTQIESGVAHGKQVGGARAPGTVEEQNLMAHQQILPERVVSGCQFGADQAGLIAARRFGIPTGGWKPGRRRCSAKNPVWRYPSGRLPPG
jgi:hypothetical protein